MSGGTGVGVGGMGVEVGSGVKVGDEVGVEVGFGCRPEQLKTVKPIMKRLRTMALVFMLFSAMLRSRPAAGSVPQFHMLL